MTIELITVFFCNVEDGFQFDPDRLFVDLPLSLVQLVDTQTGLPVQVPAKFTEYETQIAQEIT